MEKEIIFLLFGVFGAGLIIGVIGIRYGISLGIKLSYRLRNDALLDDLPSPTEQEIAGD